MKKVVGLLACSALLLTGCAINMASSVELSADDGILFISDPGNQDNEIAYYDALLEMKEQYPTELGALKVLSNEEQSPLPLKSPASGSPALIIIHNGKAIMHISGSQPKEKIVRSFEKALVKINADLNKKSPAAQ